MYLTPDDHCAHVFVLARSTTVSLLPGESGGRLVEIDMTETEKHRMARSSNGDGLAALTGVRNKEAKIPDVAR